MIFHVLLVHSAAEDIWAVSMVLVSGSAAAAVTRVQVFVGAHIFDVPRGDFARRRMAGSHGNSTVSILGT